MRSYAALKRANAAAGPQDHLTPELLGTIVALAWQEALVIPPGSTAGGGLFEAVMLDQSSPPADLPEKLQEMLDYRVSPTGIKLDQLTDMKVGAQAAGSIGRLNPQYIAPVYKSHPVEARLLLDQYSGTFPDVVDWVRHRVRAVKQPQQAA